MPKNSLQDIKPATRRSTSVSTDSSRPVKIKISTPEEIPFEPTPPKHSSRYGLWYIAVACLVGFLFSLSFLFESATVTITAKSVPITYDATDKFTAQKDSTNSDDIVYTVMKLSGDESIKLPGIQSKSQSQYATGTVVLYNAYQVNSYRLVKNTRLASSDGRIYKINSSVNIPGYTKSGGTITPGSTSVAVTAAVPGESGNIEAGDFSLPGLAGTAQAKKIYGRTKTPIEGGITGVVYTLPQDAADAALGSLREKLKNSLSAKAKVQVPDGYVYFDGATFFSTGDSVQVPYSKVSDVPLALSGTLTVYLLKQDSLVKAIAKKSISQYSGEPVGIPKLSSFEVVPATPVFSENDTTFSFSLSGSDFIVWSINSDDIKSTLANKKKSEFQSLLSSIVSVDRAELVIKPFWKRSFPSDVSRIKVVVK